MIKRALVLGGGGVLGIAWMTGLAAALHEGGLNLTEADLFVGTSAGSVVGTQLAFGFDPQFLLAAQRAEAARPAKDQPRADLPTLMAIFGKWMAAAEMTLPLRREIGAMALTARTISEEQWLAVFAGVLSEAPWPAKALKLTAVDTASGELKVWESGGEAKPVQAIASSCAVPGLFPPVTIGGHRYMDGGVRSGTNADLAAGAERLLIIAPMGSTGHPLGNRQMEAEAAALRAGGAKVAIVVPDQAALEAFGPEMMDSSRQAGAIDAGLRQGQGLRSELAGFWQA